MGYLRLSILALAAIATVAGGCGGGGEESKQEYADEVSTVLQPLEAELEQIGDVIREAESTQALADSVQNAETEIQGAVDELKAIDPPSDVEDANQTLITALERFNGTLGELSAAAKAGDTAEILSSSTELPNAVGDLKNSLETMRTQLEGAGVDVSG